jgi:hypothetical protein
MKTIGYKQITLSGTQGTFDATDLTYEYLPNLSKKTNVSTLTPASFGLTSTESASDTYTDEDGTHSYTHYKLNGTFVDALTAIASTFGLDGHDKYLNRYNPLITGTDFLLLEVIDHPPSGIGGGDEVRLIERVSGSTTGWGWHQWN